LKVKCYCGAETVQCEALFASSLQESDTVSPEAAIAEIRRMIRDLGPVGCASRMAQEFGDHPDEAHERMLWAYRLIGELAPRRHLPAKVRA